MDKQVKFTNGLTENEILILNASRITNFGDCMEDPQWSFAVCETARMNEKSYRGVVGSLVKKGLVYIIDNEGKKQFRDMLFGITKQGQKLFNLKEMQSMKEFDELEKTEDTVIIGDVEFSKAELEAENYIEAYVETYKSNEPIEIESIQETTELNFEDIIATNRYGKVSNFQGIPAMKKAIEEDSIEKLQLIKNRYPEVFNGSIRYLKRDERKYIEDHKDLI